MAFITVACYPYSVTTVPFIRILLDTLVLFITFVWSYSLRNEMFPFVYLSFDACKRVGLMVGAPFQVYANM